MKSKLTLQEKLRDLRDDKKLTLSELAEVTAIPLSTLQRMEGREDIRVGYQDVAALAKLYGVSTDYLFGLTDNRQHRNVEVDALRLSDPAIETLKSRKLNNRLMSEMIAHPDFVRLMNAVEIYIDRKVLPQMMNLKAMYQFAESTIRENFEVADNDETLAFLQESIVDEDEYLRYRITDRFNDLMKNLFAAHKKDALPDEQTGIVQQLKDDLTIYTQERDKQRGTLILLAKQIGLNIKELTDEEIEVLMKALRKSDKYKRHSNKRR